MFFRPRHQSRPAANRSHPGPIDRRFRGASQSIACSPWRAALARVFTAQTAAKFAAAPQFLPTFKSWYPRIIVSRGLAYAAERACTLHFPGDPLDGFRYGPRVRARRLPAPASRASDERPASFGISPGSRANDQVGPRTPVDSSRTTEAARGRYGGFLLFRMTMRWTCCRSPSPPLGSYKRIAPAPCASGEVA